MILLTRKEFRQQPAGILYRKKLPHYGSFQEIEIKADTCGGNDFVCMDFGSTHPAYGGDDIDDLPIGSSRPLDLDYYGRDGCYEDDAIFLVYETWDLEQLRTVIDRAITVAPKQVFEKPWHKG